MQITGLHKNIYKLSSYALSQEKLESHRKKYEKHEKWNIVLPENYVTDWFLADGTNNCPIRAERTATLKRALGMHL